MSSDAMRFHMLKAKVLSEVKKNIHFLIDNLKKVLVGLIFFQFEV
jgi:hypothetical protein